MEPAADIEHLERGLLRGENCAEDGEDEEAVLFRASFDEAEERFVKYQTARWVLYSLVLILAWGIGLLMLIYLPFRRCIFRRDFRSRKLYVTPNSVVYKVRRPVLLPCCGVLKKEKHVLLPSVADVVIEQGYLESVFGVYSVRIENVGVRRPPSDDVQIQGVANPHAFRKAVLIRLSNMSSELFSGHPPAGEDVPRMGHSSVASMSPSRSARHDPSFPLDQFAILQKLEEVGSTVKRVETLIDEQNLQTPARAD
ncbi:uncharacterized protein LOC127263354 [Andrographis paniculata]|uniref:uncharacterized protein LOC127263354 n=1 Tax=Andrographis paniculata TaxID=175694 RepID=UPI0021E7B0E4|nr:uncharacterized protein LOC127263354 [Andrographis paniculata]